MSMFNLCMFKVAKQFICSVDTYTHEGWIALNIYEYVFKNYLFLKSVLSYTIILQVIETYIVQLSMAHDQMCFSIS